MIHLIGNTDTGLFEVVCVSKNGNYLLGSRQGYERKSGCYKCIRSLMKNCFYCGTSYFQDDTLKVPKVFMINLTGKVLDSTEKPKKRYVPNK